MELSPLFGALGTSWFDDILIWSVASVAAVIGIVAIVSALEMFFETETG